MPEQSPLVQSAKKYLAAGLSVIPIGDTKTKRPPDRFSWKRYQSERMTQAEAERAFVGAQGIAIIAGKVSGCLEVVDIDTKEDRKGTLAQDFAALVNEADLPALCIQQTVSGGYHVPYRCAFQPAGNQKLAMRPPEADEKGEKCLIETRGEGGYIQCYPSPGYSVIRRGFDDLPTLDAEQVETLHAICRSFDQSTTRSTLPRALPIQGDDLRPGDHYNQKEPPEATLDLLTRHGWAVARESGDRWHLTRPDKPKGVSATLFKSDGTFYVFSSSTEFPINAGLSPFSVYTTLEHGGDYSAAARAYGEAAGLNKQYERIKSSPELPSPETQKTDFWPVITWGQSTRPTSFEEAKKRRPPVVLDGLFYERSKLLVGGVAKLGKSLFCGNLAAALACQQPFLHWEPKREFKVVYIDFELHQWELDERLAAMCDYALPDNLGTISLRSRPEIRTREALVKLFTETFTKDTADVIFLDCLYKFAGLDDESSNSQMAEIGKFLDEVVEITQAALVLVHHFGKGDQGGKEVIDRFRGASSLVGEMDGILSLTNHEELNHFIVESSVRSFRPLEPFVVQKAYPRFTLTEKDASRRRKLGAPQKVTDESIMEKLGDAERYGQTAAEIAPKIGLSSRKLKMRLDELFRTGKIQSDESDRNRLFWRKSL